MSCYACPVCSSAIHNPELRLTGDVQLIGALYVHTDCQNRPDALDRMMAYADSFGAHLPHDVATDMVARARQRRVDAERGLYDEPVAVFEGRSGTTVIMRSGRSWDAWWGSLAGETDDKDPRWQPSVLPPIPGTEAEALSELPEAEPV